MNKLPKYAREFYNTTTEYLYSTLKIKKKEFFSKLNSMDCDGFARYIKRLAPVKAQKGNFVCIRNMDNAVDFICAFDKTLHFCVKEIDETECSEVKVPIEQDREVIIDFSYGDVEYFVDIWARKWNLDIKDNITTYAHMELYSKREDVMQYNKEHLGVDFGSTYKFLPMYKLHITENYEGMSVECPEGNRWLMDTLNTNTYKTMTGERMLAIEGIDEIGQKCDIPTPGMLLNLYNHVMSCYINRDTLTRKSSSTSKHYDKQEVFIQSKSVTEVESDIYIPLRAYVKSQHYASKGNTHASPCEHERCGFFRKSRGKGDYILKDGKFIYIGNKEGEYSYVNSTHVSGRKHEGVLIYKV